MTMPHLMNCPHSGEGWCLDCVKRMGDINAVLLAACEAALDDDERRGKLLPHARSLLRNAIAKAKGV